VVDVENLPVEFHELHYEAQVLAIYNLHDKTLLVHLKLLTPENSSCDNCSPDYENVDLVCNLPVFSTKIVY